MNFPCLEDLLKQKTHLLVDDLKKKDEYVSGVVVQSGSRPVTMFAKRMQTDGTAYLVAVIDTRSLWFTDRTKCSYFDYCFYVFQKNNIRR